MYIFGVVKDWILVGAIEDDSHIKLNRISRHRPSPTNKFKPSNTRIIPSIARFSSDKVDPVPDLAQHEARYSAAWDYLAIPGSLLWSNWQAICSPRGGRTGRLHLSLRGIRLNVTKAERTHAHAYTHTAIATFLHPFLHLPSTSSYAWRTLQPADMIIGGDRNILLVKRWKFSKKSWSLLVHDSLRIQSIVNRRWHEDIVTLLESLGCIAVRQTIFRNSNYT